jgi:hypothetical protein
VSKTPSKSLLEQEQELKRETRTFQYRAFNHQGKDEKNPMTKLTLIGRCCGLFSCRQENFAQGELDFLSLLLSLNVAKPREKKVNEIFDGSPGKDGNGLAFPFNVSKTSTMRMVKLSSALEYSGARRPRAWMQQHANSHISKMYLCRWFSQPAAYLDDHDPVRDHVEGGALRIQEEKQIPHRGD